MTAANSANACGPLSGPTKPVPTRPRTRVVPFLKKATPLFFFGQLSEAARQLDLARMALESDKEPDTARRWAESLVFRPESRLFDASAETVPFTLDAFYEVAAETPEKARVRLTWCAPDGKPLDGEPLAVLDVKALPFKDKAPRKNAVAGDYLWRCEVLSGDRLLARWEQTLSFASHLDGRLERLRKAVGDPADKCVNTDRETSRMLTNLLTRLQNKETLETNYPAARLLDEAEAAADGKPSYGRARPGQFWLKLGLEKGPPFVRTAGPGGGGEGPAAAAGDRPARRGRQREPVFRRLRRRRDRATLREGADGCWSRRAAASPPALSTKSTASIRWTESASS